MQNGRVFHQLLRAAKYINHACRDLDGAEADTKAIEEWKQFYCREAIIERYLTACRLLFDNPKSIGKLCILMTLF